MAATLNIEPNETLDSLVERIKSVNGTDEVVLALPEDTTALRTLDDFNVLRTTVRDKGLRASFLGGNRTTRGLAKILGFNVTEGAADTMPPGMSPLSAAATQPILRDRPGNTGNFPPARAPLSAPPSIQDTLGIERTPFDIPALDVNITPPAPPPGTAEVRIGQRGQPQPRQPRDFETNNGGRTVPPAMDFTFNAGDMTDTRTGRNGNSSGNGFIPAESQPPRDFDVPPSRTMSMDEALRSGYLRGTNFDGNAPAAPSNGGYGLIDTDPLAEQTVPDLEFPADGAGTLPTSGVRRGRRNAQPETLLSDDDTQAVPPTNSRRRVGPNTGVMLLGAVSNAFRRPRRNPLAAQPTASGVSPSREAERRQRTRMPLFISIAVLIVTLLLIFLTTGGFVNQPGGSLGPLAGNGDNTTPGTNPIAKAGVKVVLNVPSVAGQQVSLTLQPTNSPAQPAATTPAATGATATANSANATPSAAFTGVKPGVLPVRTITKNGISVTGQLTPDKLFPVKVGDKYAGGDLYVNNGNAVAISFGNGETVMTVNGVSFVTTSAVTIPAADLSTGLARAAVFPVVASVKGSVGNMAIGGFVSRTKPNLFIKKSQMSGGTDKTVYKVTDDNAKDPALLAQMNDKVKAQAIDTINGLKGQADILAGDVTISNTKLTLDPPAGTLLDAPAPVKATMTANATGYTYTQDALNAAVAASLSNPTGATLTNITIGSPKITNANGKMTLSGTASASVATPDQGTLQAALQKALAGQPVNQAQAIVNQTLQAQANGLTATVATDATFSDPTFPADPTAIDITFPLSLSGPTPAGSATTAPPLSGTPGITPTVVGQSTAAG